MNTIGMFKDDLDVGDSHASLSTTEGGAIDDYLMGNRRRSTMRYFFENMFETSINSKIG